jgi:heme exporter protein B
MGFWRDVGTLLWKDLLLEVRTKEVIYAVLFYAVMAVMIFSFAFTVEPRLVVKLAPGMFWVSITFAGTLGLLRAYDRERQGDAARGLLVSPASRAAIYVGKTLGVVFFMAIAELVTLPLMVLLFNLSIGHALGSIALVALLGTIGYAAVGSLFAAMLMQARSREVLLAIALYPVLVPLIIAAVKGTSAALNSEGEELRFWLSFLAVCDVLFTVAALWAFEPLVTD